jgi:hypothetical protein
MTQRKSITHNNQQQDTPSTPSIVGVGKKRILNVCCRFTVFVGSTGCQIRFGGVKRIGSILILG